MQLKTYQQKALEQLDGWIDALRKARINNQRVIKTLENEGLDIPAELQNSPLSAWNSMREQGVIPAVAVAEGGKLSADGREYLIRNLAVPENQIWIQSSERKELSGDYTRSSLQGLLTYSTLTGN